MAVDLAKLAGNVKDAPEPIKRTADRSGGPNPFEPILTASWDARTARGHNGAEIGATKQVRVYTDEQATAAVRALRKASDTLGLGVKIDAPTEDYTDLVPLVKDGQVVTDEAGAAVTEEKRRTRFVAGTVKFEAVKRQERKRKPADEQASADEPESTDQDEQDAGAEDEQDGDALPEDSDDGAQEPAWTS
jgi:hypothetical protein